MAISSTNNNGSSNAVSTATSSGTKLAADFDQFLLLLTTQLKNQDPTSPLETNDFTQQLVGFSQVEQAIDSNKNLEKLVNIFENNQINNTVSYIGKTVIADSSSITLKDGNASYSYSLGSNVSSATAHIKDKDGNIIYNTNVDKNAGNHTITWNGKDNEGNEAKDGLYTVQITATNSNGEDVPVSTQIVGVVTGVKLNNGSPILQIGDLEVESKNVTAVTS